MNGWAKGDLALCVSDVLSDDPDAGDCPLLPHPGGVYTVERLRMVGAIDQGAPVVVSYLELVGSHGWAYRHLAFRKIHPLTDEETRDALVDLRADGAVMTAIRRLDAWIGKRIMHPPVIWICQRAGVNQFVVYRMLWWAVALHQVFRDQRTSWLMTTFIILFAATRTLSAGIAPGRPAVSNLWLRMFGLALALIDLMMAALIGRNGVPNLADMVLSVVAEYAATIVTIPPRKLPAPKRTVARAHA